MNFGRTSRASTWESTVRVRDHVTALSLSGGDAPGTETIVLLHAAMLDRRMWTTFMASLTGLLATSTSAVRAMSGHRVVAYDLRGHGAARGAPPITDVDQLADDLAAVLDQIDVEAAHVCGLSFGGAVAQAFAARHPARVHSLVLVATDLTFPAEVMNARATSFTADTRVQVIETTLRRWFSPGALSQRTPAVSYARDCLLATSPEHWSATWRSLGRFDVSGHASNAGVPTLAVSGAQDPATPPERLDAVARAYRRSRHVTVDPGPHMISLECADVLARLVSEFLTEMT